MKTLKYLPNIFPPLFGDDALVVDILAAANILLSAPPNNDALWEVVVGLVPNTDAWVVCVGVPNTEDWVDCGGVPNTEVWADGEPKIDPWLAGAAVPNTDAWDVGDPNTEDWAVAVAVPNTLCVVVVVLPNTDDWLVPVPNMLWAVVAAALKAGAWLVAAPNTLVVDVGVPNTDDCVVPAPNIEPVGDVENTDGCDWDAAANTEGADVAKTDWVDVVPNTDVAVGVVLNTDGLASLVNTDDAVVVAKIELDVVVVAVPNIQPGEVDPNTLEVGGVVEPNSEPVCAGFGWDAAAAPNIDAADDVFEANGDVFSVAIVGVVGGVACVVPNIDPVGVTGDVGVNTLLDSERSLTILLSNS
jgi:hypothetical protein